MEEQVIIGILEVLDKNALLPVNFIRNIKVKSRYKELIASGLPCKEVREKIADEFFIGIKMVEYIIYDLKNKCPVMN